MQGRIRCGRDNSVKRPPNTIYIPQAPFQYKGFLGMADKSFYYKLEDGYYSFMDTLEQKGWKPYERFVNPVEKRGIPSFPLACLIVLLIIALVGFLAYGALNPATTILTIKTSSESQLLDGVQVTAEIEGGQTLSAVSKDGVARFENVPLGRKVIIRLSKDGFDSIAKDITVSKDDNSVSAELQKTKPPTVPLIMFVSDENGAALSDATISYRNPTTGEFSSGATDATGRLSIELASEATLQVSASSTGFEKSERLCVSSQKECELKLRRTVSQQSETKGSVRTEVKDSLGNPSQARITLYNADTGKRIDAEQTDRQGVAFFDKIAATGTLVYVVAEPDSSSGLLYNQGAEDPHEVTDETVFKVTLQAKTAENLQGLSIKVVKEDGTAASGAEVKVFLFAKPNLPLASKTTGDDGNANFELAEGTKVYLTAYANGFLPQLVQSPEAATTIKLVKAIAGNNGQAKVTVTDENDGVTELAEVALLTKDGFNTGVPTQQTSADGSASFGVLPLGEFKAIATAGSKSGESDVFEVNLVQAAEATVKLNPTKATVKVSLVEVGTTKQLIGKIASLNDAGEEDESCQTNATSFTCAIKVLANKPIKLKATSAGYADATTELLTLTTNQQVSKKINLIPSNLANSLSILDFHVEDEEGKNVSRLDKAGTYKAILSFNIPSEAKKAGAIIRVGDKATSQEDGVEIKAFDKPSEADTTSSSTYSRSSCESDAFSHDDTSAKWVEYDYKEKTFGVKTVAVTFQVKTTADTSQPINVYYRIFAEKGDLTLRVPQDAELGDARKTESKDYCYADSKKLIFQLNNGLTTCNERACITTLFEEGTNKKTNGLQTTLDKEVKATITVRSITPIESPSLKVTTDSPLKLLNANFGSSQITEGNSYTAVLDQSTDKTGTIYLKAVLPSQQAKMLFTLSDSSEEILNAERFIVVDGTGKMLLAVSPLNIQANKDTPIKITLTTQTGEAVPDAKITIDESFENPLDGAVDGPISTLGDNTENNGEEGRYRLSVAPVSVGKLKVTAKKNGFKEESQEITVEADDFLEFDSDLSNINLECDPITLTATNKLKATVKVTASFSGGSCVSILGAARTGAANTTGYSFDVKPDKDKTLTLRPVTNGACVLSFSAKTPSGSATSQQDAFITTNCAATASPSPSPGVAATTDPNAANNGAGQGGQPQMPGGGQGGQQGQAAQQAQALRNFCSGFFKDIFVKLGKGILTGQIPGTSVSKPIPATPKPQNSAVGVGNKANTVSDGTQSKTITPIVPFNAFSFSVTNNEQNPTTLLFSEQPKTTCYRIVDKAVSFQELVAGKFPSEQYTKEIAKGATNSYIVYYVSSSDCVDYSVSKDGVTVNPKQPSLTLGIRSTSNANTPEAKITFSIKAENEATKAYAVTYSPNTGFTYRTNEIKEPFYYANNIHSNTPVKIKGDLVPLSTFKYTKLTKDEAIKLEVGVASTEIKLNANQVKSAWEAKLDVVGNPTKQGDCRDSDFCEDITSTEAKAKAALQAVIAQFGGSTSAVNLNTGGQGQTQTTETVRTSVEDPNSILPTEEATKDLAKAMKSMTDYLKTSPADARTAENCIRGGVSPEQVYQQQYGQNPYGTYSSPITGNAVAPTGKVTIVQSVLDEVGATTPNQASTELFPGFSVKIIVPIRKAGQNPGVYEATYLTQGTGNSPNNGVPYVSASQGVTK